MSRSSHVVPRSPSRRRFLLTAGAGTLAAFGAGLPASTTAAVVEHRLVARPARMRLVPEPHPETDIWSYNDSAPGPEIRVRQGDRLRVTVENGLDEATTIHWHGIRLPNAMDGVPYITQPPIEPGGSFVYEYTLPDAGTYWYHPHQRSYEQSGRGMHGALIVEERNPVRVDRDVVWVLGDWSQPGCVDPWRIRTFHGRESQRTRGQYRHYQWPRPGTRHSRTIGLTLTAPSH